MSNQHRKKQKGQALVEYVLLIVMVAGAIGVLYARMPRFFNLMESQVKSDLPRAYKYGHPKACGNDASDPQPCGGTAEKHPAYRNSDNFRLFSRGA